MIPAPLLIGGGLAIAGGVTALLLHKKAVNASKQLQDPATLSAVVDKLPASSVSKPVAAQISTLQVGLPEGQGIADPALEKQLSERLAAAQATALASPSLANNAAVIQAAVDNAAFTAAEDSFDPRGGGPIPEGTLDPTVAGDFGAMRGRRPRLVHAPNFAHAFRTHIRHTGGLHPRTVGTFRRGA